MMQLDLFGSHAVKPEKTMCFNHCIHAGEDHICRKRTVLPIEDTDKCGYYVEDREAVKKWFMKVNAHAASLMRGGK